jgi:hypothetical protein
MRKGAPDRFGPGKLAVSDRGEGWAATRKGVGSLFHVPAKGHP